MANKRKTTTAVVAGVTAVALLLGGTFAWTSISQTAKNESAGIVNVGGRLHDDFNGKNKDVYVENFTDPYNGGQPIYARVRLDEYMEVGKDAGGIDVDNDGTIDAVPVITGTERGNTETWKPHVPSAACATCNSGDTCLIHDHWTWTMGGDNGTTGSTVFMPTFNKDKDSLEADVNGTYHGTDDADKVYYDDYVVYTTDETGGAVNEADKEAFDGEIYSVTGDAQYDNDPDTDKNTIENDDYILKTETHTAKETAAAKVITMAQWLAEDGEYKGQPGNYWVYDDDGWAYWANPIMPGEATGLLLDGIEMTSNPGEKCYYAINVVGQFATVGDWEQFGVSEEDEDYPSDDAIALLTKASESVPTVTVTNVTGDTLVNRGGTVEFSATTAIGAASAAEDGEYDWFVLNEDRQVITSSTIAVNADGNAILTVGPEELSAGLYVAARDTKTGAVGLSAVAVQIYNVTITEENNTTVAKAGTSLKFSASVVDGSTGDTEPSGVTWSLRGNTINTTTISEDGVLTIAADEPGATVLTVTAASVKDSFVKTYTVTVADKYTVTVSQADNATVVFPGNKLQFSAAMTKNGETVTPPDVEWSVSGGSGSTAVDKDGLLTVDENEKGAATLTVKATCKADETVSDTYTVTVNRYAVSLSGGASTVTPGASWQFNAAVTLNGKTDTASGVTWKVTDASGAQVSGVTVDETGKLSVATTVVEGTELTVTATSNANGSVSAAKQLTVKKAELVMRLYTYDNFNSIKDTIENGENRSSSIYGGSLTTQIRVYDTDGNWLEGATMTIFANGQDVTEFKDGVCTNGYVSEKNHWWAWSANGNTTPITFKITYGTSTFEATIW